MLIAYFVNIFVAFCFLQLQSLSVKDKSPLVFKIETELHERLEECARRLKQKKYSLAIEAIRAAVEAIERNGYKLVIPIEFEATHVAVPKAEPSTKDSPGSSLSPSPQPEEDAKNNGKNKKSKAA